MAEQEPPNPRLDHLWPHPTRGQCLGAGRTDRAWSRFDRRRVRPAPDDNYTLRAAGEGQGRDKYLAYQCDFWIRDRNQRGTANTVATVARSHRTGSAATRGSVSCWTLRARENLQRARPRSKLQTSRSSFAAQPWMVASEQTVGRYECDYPERRGCETVRAARLLSIPRVVESPQHKAATRFRREPLPGGSTTRGSQVGPRFPRVTRRGRRVPAPLSCGLRPG